jgi:hypothetical protein
MAMSSNPLDVITFGEAMLLLIAESVGLLDVQTFANAALVLKPMWQWVFTPG